MSSDREPNEDIGAKKAEIAAYKKKQREFLDEHGFPKDIVIWGYEAINNRSGRGHYSYNTTVDVSVLPKDDLAALEGYLRRISNPQRKTPDYCFITFVGSDYI